MALALRPHPAVERLCGQSNQNATRPPPHRRDADSPPRPACLFYCVRPCLPSLPLASRSAAVVDIAPAVGAISPEFREYLTAMKAIEAAQVKSRKEADAILQDYEKVRHETSTPRVDSNDAVHLRC